MTRSAVLASALLFAATPALLAVVEAVSFYSRNATNASVVSSGVRRDYLIHIPPGYRPGHATPLVISLHAAGLWPAAQADISRMNSVADEKGFIAVYPAAGGVGVKIWHVETSPLLQRDAQFIADMIDTVETQYTIDATRVYADGLSNGGGMSFVLTCVMHDRIAAVGLVASAQTLPFSWCPDKRPMPMIAFHGTADPVTPYHGGTSWISPRSFPDITYWVASWAQRNGCSAVPLDSSVAADVNRRTYADCDADVAFYTVRGGGHTWPGGQPLAQWLTGRTAASINASSVMWDFFRAHPAQRHRASRSGQSVP